MFDNWFKSWEDMFALKEKTMWIKKLICKIFHNKKCVCWYKKIESGTN
jgi:hypothetical protein